MIGLVAVVLALGYSNVDAFEKTAGEPGMAISLSYDDALDSQLDTVVPALNRYQLKASFYLTLASPVVRERLPQWRAAAQQGHELGNHTLFHPCRASLAGREWVRENVDLDTYSLAKIIQEIELANHYLHAIDGRSVRTFTPPCGDVKVKDAGNYIAHMADKFVAIKGFEAMPPGQAVLWGPVAVAGTELISRIEQQAKSGTRLLNILFHGVGGDHLSVSAEAHEQLLAYLAANRESYRLGTYIELMSALQAEDKAPH